MSGDLTKDQKRALRAAAQLAHQHDQSMPEEDRDVYYLEVGNADLPLLVGGAVAHGIITIDQVPDAARELVRDVASRLSAVFDALERNPSPLEEKVPYDPDAVVSIASIVRQIDSLTDESTLFVNRRTGEVTVANEDDDEADDSNDPAQSSPGLPYADSSITRAPLRLVGARRARRHPLLHPQSRDHSARLGSCDPSQDAADDTLSF